MFAAYLFLAPYMAFFLLFIVLPLVGGLALGFFDWELISGRPPRFIGLGNYAEAMRSDYFWMAIVATFKFVILIVPLTIGIAMPIAVGIHGAGTGRQGFYRAAYFLPGVISISVAGLIWRWFYTTEFGLFNALLAGFGVKVGWLNSPDMAMLSIAIMTLWWTVGGPVIILGAGLNEIPRQYYEASRIDGANAWQQFRHITLPLLKPVLLFVVVMNIITSFQVFGQTFMITRGAPEFSTRVMVQYIYETAFAQYRMGYGTAMSWLLFIVILAFAMLQFRLLREPKES
jgi:multiple sugar transport system permease protein